MQKYLNKRILNIYSFPTSIIITKTHTNEIHIFFFYGAHNIHVRLSSILLSNPQFYEVLEFGKK